MLRNGAILTILAVICWIFSASQRYPQFSQDSPIIVDMVLSSPSDRPEPYVEQYINEKESLQVRKVQVVGAPNSSGLSYVAFLTTGGGGVCQNLWFVRIIVKGTAAQALGRIMSCDEAIRVGALRTGPGDLAVQFVPTWWPKASDVK